VRALYAVLTALEARDCRPRGSDERGYAALCPAHEDRTPSLSVTYRDEKVLLHCHAGCPVDAVLSALALDYTDLFDEEASCRK